MKRSPLKRKSKTERAKLIDKLWELCKQIVRKRDGNTCFICGQTGLEGSGWHTGHLIPSSTCGAYLRHDLRNLASSCYNCNINCGGNGALFLRRVEEVHGKEYADQIIKDKQIIIKADVLFYRKKIEEHQEILDNM